MLHGIARVVAAVSRLDQDGRQYHGAHRVMVHTIRVGHSRACSLALAFEHIKGGSFPEPKQGTLTLKNCAGN
jgi:hypothetical protein